MADIVQTILHTIYTVFHIDNQCTYNKKCRVQTVLQKTVTVDFSPASAHLHTHTSASTTRTTSAHYARTH